MVGKPEWNAGLVYVDLFAGPGICQVKESGKRLPGSPLLAAHTPKPFRRSIMVELDPRNVKACRERLRKIAPDADTVVLEGDCNATVGEVASLIPPGCLTLAFIDPEGFDLRMDTLESLAAGRQVDFLLLFADAIDLVRNIDLYERQAESKLSLAFGADDVWRPAWESLSNRTGANVRQLFAKVFASEIKRRLGYQGVREEVISGPKGPLYRLVYASKHERGLEFWDKISAKDFDGQASLFGGS